MKYFKCGKQLSRKIIEQLDSLDNLKAKARAFGIEKGCSDPEGRFYFSDDFGRWQVSGYKFDNPPDGWVRMSRTISGAYKPGARSHDRKEFESLRGFQPLEIMNLIEMKPLAGLSVRRPGVIVVGAVVYLEVPDDVSPSGAKRISDIEHEQATKKTVLADN